MGTVKMGVRSEESTTVVCIDPYTILRMHLRLISLVGKNIRVLIVPRMWSRAATARIGPTSDNAPKGQYRKDNNRESPSPFALRRNARRVGVLYSQGEGSTFYLSLSFTVITL